MLVVNMNSSISMFSWPFFAIWNHNLCSLKIQKLISMIALHGIAFELVTTLALGSWPRQGLARVRDKREAREAHLIFSRVQEIVREWTLTLPSDLPLGELESIRTPESSRRNCRGQNPLEWKVLYIIEKLLKRRCLKWACITHLDIWNTSYGQKKGWESNWQFDSQPLKVKNRPDFLVCKWHAT